MGRNYQATAESVWGAATQSGVIYRESAIRTSRGVAWLLQHCGIRDRYTKPSAFVPAVLVLEKNIIIRKNLSSTAKTYPMVYLPEGQSCLARETLFRFMGRVCIFIERALQNDGNTLGFEVNGHALSERNQLQLSTWFDGLDRLFPVKLSPEDEALEISETAVCAFCTIYRRHSSSVRSKRLAYAE